MAIIGTFGSISFEVSSKRIKTFDNLTRNGDARWAIHENLLVKPVPEFIGPGQDELNFTIRLSAYQKVNPILELDKLRAFKNAGKVAPFVLGGRSVSSSHWYIEKLGEAITTVNGKGLIITAEADLTLKEYPKVFVPRSKSRPKPTTKSSNTSKRTSTGKITIKAGMLNCRSSPSLKGKIVKVLRKGQVHIVYGTKKGDILWYDLGGGKYCSANSKYVSYKKG